MKKRNYPPKMLFRFENGTALKSCSDFVPEMLQVIDINDFNFAELFRRKFHPKAEGTERGYRPLLFRFQHSGNSDFNENGLVRELKMASNFRSCFGRRLPALAHSGWLASAVSKVWVKPPKVAATLAAKLPATLAGKIFRILNSEAGTPGHVYIHLLRCLRREGGLPPGRNSLSVRLFKAACSPGLNLRLDGSQISGHAVRPEVSTTCGMAVVFRRPMTMPHPGSSGLTDHHPLRQKLWQISDNKALKNINRFYRPFYPPF